MATPDAVAAFMDITKVPESVAVQKLEEYGGNLSGALNAYFLERDGHILSGQGQNAGILSFLNTAFTSRPPSRTSHPAEVREGPAGINSAFEPHYQSGLSTKGADTSGNSSSHGLGTHGLAQSSASQVPDAETEEAMLQAAIEASKVESRSELEGMEKMLDNKEVSPSEEPPFEIIVIAVRMPDGRRLERRFLKTDTLQLLFDFVDIVGFKEIKSATYRLVKSFPRRAYSINDSSSTFNEVGLSNDSETLFLEWI